MQQTLLNEIPPQKDVITLLDARTRIANFQELMKEVYDPTPGNAPRGFFVPFMDILELRRLQEYNILVTPPGGTEPVKAYVVGIRAYYTLQNPIIIEPPYNAREYPVDGILVAVYQTNTEGRKAGTDSEFAYFPEYDNYDLVISVNKAGDVAATVDEYVSVYDITQPCPNLCGNGSELYP
jgi:hypothetical protein